MNYLKKLNVFFTITAMINAYTQTAPQAVSPQPIFTKPKAIAAKPLAAKAVTAAPKVAPKATEATKVVAPTAKQPAATLPVAAQATPKAIALTHVPYLKELQDAKMSPAILSGWQQLYASITSNVPANAAPASAAPAPAVSARTIATNSLFTTNFFDMIANYLNPTTFPKFTNDADGQIHFNYATNHLRAAAVRLGSISSITDASGTPAVNFAGDCRDMGIIVNIQNNSDVQFSINQTSLDGTSTVQIGSLNPGLNEVNLHTAALQSATAPTAKTTTGSLATAATTKYYFEIVENITDPSINISLKIYSGTEFISFLKSLPHKGKDSIEMNGLPTSSKYLATPADWYLVLIQNPTQAGASQPNPDQRIQAINLSKLSGPYLLTMQINQQSIEVKTSKSKHTTAMMNVSQPSLNTVLEVKNKTFTTKNYPLIILPQFLWSMPTLQAYWMLLNSCYITALSNFKFFGPQTFGDAFEYFTGLGCFDMSNKYAFISDLYNLLTPGDAFHDSTWLMGSALYATNLNYCSDFPQLHSSQDAQGNIICNGNGFFYLNFQIKLYPQNNNISSSLNLFAQKGFIGVFEQPEYQLWTILCSILMTKIKEGIFAELIEIQKETYQLTWTNKKTRY